MLTTARHLPGAQEFLAGANNMDEHFKNQPYSDNLPVLIGLLSVWNVSFLGYGAKAILPYCQVSAVPSVQAKCRVNWAAHGASSAEWRSSMAARHDPECI